MGEASERAYAADATPEQRALATAYGAPIGLTELLPIKSLGFLKNNFSSYLGKIFLEGGIEGAQEAASELAQNLVEQGIYNPEKGTIEGTGESFGVGAGTGAIVQALLGLLPGKTRGGGATEALQITDTKLLPAPNEEEIARATPPLQITDTKLLAPPPAAEAVQETPEQTAQRARDEAIAILNEDVIAEEAKIEEAKKEAKIAEAAAEADRRAEEAALANKTAPALGTVIGLPAFNDEEFDAQAEELITARENEEARRKQENRWLGLDANGQTPQMRALNERDAKARVDLKERQEQSALRDKQERDAAAAEEAAEEAAEKAAEEAAAQELAAEKLKSTVDAPQRDLFGEYNSLVKPS
jgi:hypothetical protein